MSNAQKKQQTTWLQRAVLFMYKFLWLSLPKNERRSWQEIKQGFKPHKHDFSIKYCSDGFWYAKCGCKGCDCTVEATA